MPHVMVVTTGGTIASRHDEGYGGNRAVVPGDELLLPLSRLHLPISLSTQTFALIDSREMRPSMMIELATLLQEMVRVDSGVTGLVVTHGTDTLEETAFVLSCLLEIEQPVVLTGAMRASDVPGGDGLRNLTDAVRVAADPLTRGTGVVVVLAGQVHAARHVAKRHTSALDAFMSPETGPIGHVDGTNVHLDWVPRPLPRLSGTRFATGVELVTVFSGMSDRLFRLLLEHGIEGLVIEAFGSGNVTDDLMPAISDIIDARVPVVLASRCDVGRVSAGWSSPR